MYRVSLNCVNKVVLIALLAVLGLSGCSSLSGGPEPDTLRVNIGTEPDSLDWHLTTDSISFDVVCNLMQGLTQYTKDVKTIPAIAEKWDILDGGRRYIFHLRSDALWTDGKPVVAGDFEYAWKRILNPKTGAPYAFFLYDIVNAKEYNAGQEKDPANVGVKALDDRTLEVKLKRPAAYFVQLAAYGPTLPMRKDIIEKYGDRWSEPGHMVTNGPFILSSWQHEYKIELASNPRYFGGEPKVKKIRMFMVPEQSTAFALYENNELDYIDNRSISTPDIERFRNSPEYHNFPLLRNTYVGFNNTKKPFDDHRVRLAFSMALDRTVFPEILRRGERPLYTWIPPGLPGYSPESSINYDPARARALMAEAGYKDGKGFPSVDLLYPYRDDTRLVVEAIQDQLKRNLGVQISLQKKEWKVYLDTLHRDPPPLFRGTWGADYPDPETFGNLFTSSNGNNDIRYKNKEYDRLIEAAEAELDPKVRADLYARADKILIKDDAALAPVFSATQNIMAKPWVHGIAVNALDLQFFKDVWISRR